MIRTIALLLLATCSVSRAQEPKVDWQLASDIGVHALDVYSTHYMLTQGYHEVILPRAVADHTWSMSLAAGGAVTVDWFVGHELRKHHHPVLARVIPALDEAGDAYFAIHNLTLVRPTIKVLPTRVK